MWENQIENNTRARVDMEFLLENSTRYRAEFFISNWTPVEKFHFYKQPCIILFNFLNTIALTYMKIRLNQWMKKKKIRVKRVGDKAQDYKKGSNHYKNKQWALLLIHTILSLWLFLTNGRNSLKNTAKIGREKCHNQNLHLCCAWWLHFSFHWDS